MAEGPKNSYDASDDDWAMSEPAPNQGEKESEIVQKPEDVNENVSSLYDPLDTGDLEDWDISNENVPPPEYSPALGQQSQEHDSFHDTFRSPKNKFEIIEPEKPHVNQESWEVKSVPQDGWQMPQVQFRSSEGRSTKIGKEDFEVQAFDANVSQEVDENLSQIYSPPETADSFDETSEDDDLPFPEDEIEDFEREDFEEMPEPESYVSESYVEEKTLIEEPIRKGKTFAFLFVGFLVVILVLAGILGVAYFFYFDTLGSVFGI